MAGPVLWTRLAAYRLLLTAYYSVLKYAITSAAS